MLNFKEFLTVDKISNKEGVNVSPSYWGYRGCYYWDIPKEELAKLTTEASLLTGVVFPVFEDEVGKKFVLVTVGKCQSPMLLFNAQQTSVADSQYFVYTYNTGKGALTQYWTAKRIKYAAGEIWQA